MKVLTDLYASLYQPQRSQSLEDLSHYIEEISLPTLTAAQRGKLDALITLAELQRATSSFPICKGPGYDCIPIEVYVRYG